MPEEEFRAEIEWGEETYSFDYQKFMRKGFVLLERWIPSRRIFGIFRLTNSTQFHSSLYLLIIGVMRGELEISTTSLV